MDLFGGRLPALVLVALNDVFEGPLKGGARSLGLALGRDQTHGGQVESLATKTLLKG